MATSMVDIDLTEYQKSAPVALTVDARDALREAVKSLTIEPALGLEGAYVLTPGSTVGAVELGDLSVVIAPKIPMKQVLSLALYAMDASDLWQKLPFNFAGEEALPDLLARALADAARRAFLRGLLHGYRTEEEALYGVRGRIRFDEQLRRRFGLPLPVEVRYDEFTEDILENRLVNAAAGRLAAMRLRSPTARRELGWIAGTLADVSTVEYAPNHVPEVIFDRLNGHYRQVVTLARLVLQHSAFQSSRGAVRAIGFLFDMDDVFQRFLTRALREKLGLSDRAFRSDKKLPKITLDEAKSVGLEPDLSWWEGDRCVFVGDAKYKNLTGKNVPNDDLYQLLAYATALRLPGGLLIYAKGEANVGTYQVSNTDKSLEVAALDLSGNFGQVLQSVGDLAKRVRCLQAKAVGNAPAVPTPN